LSVVELIEISLLYFRSDGSYFALKEISLSDHTNDSLLQLEQVTACVFLYLSVLAQLYTTIDQVCVR